MRKALSTTALVCAVLSFVVSGYPLLGIAVILLAVAQLA